MDFIANKCDAKMRIRMLALLESHHRALSGRSIGGPSADNCLGLCVKLHRALAVEMNIAKKRVLQAGPRKVGQRDWNGHIETNEPNLDRMLKSASAAATCSENCCPVAIAISIDEIDGLFQSINLNTTQNRPKYFLCVAGH